MVGGHGHVTPRPDGMRARCGGPGLCDQCSREAGNSYALILDGRYTVFPTATSAGAAARDIEAGRRDTALWPLRDVGGEDC